MSAWSPSQYLRFEDERTRPALELLARVPVEHADLVVDIGCGPGNSTELLVNRYPRAEVLGLDSSRDMLQAARERLPTARFVEADAAHWLPDRPADVIFANAVFQWVPNHLDVLAKLATVLAPGGALAVQMPDNLGEPSHALMRAVAKEGPWARKLEAAGVARDRIGSPATYYDRLKPLVGEVDIWHTGYNHVLANPAAIVDWLKATGLRPFLAPLDEAERRAFVAAYEAKLAEAYPPLVDGNVMLRFPRLFVVAVKR